MTIFTQYGVEVTITKVLSDMRDMVIVQSVEEPSWQRERHIMELKADGGIQEISLAIDKAQAEQ